MLFRFFYISNHEKHSINELKGGKHEKTNSIGGFCFGRIMCKCTKTNIVTGLINSIIASNKELASE